MLIRPSYFSPPLLDESHGRRTSAAGSAAQELRSVTGRGCKPLPGGDACSPRINCDGDDGTCKRGEAAASAAPFSVGAA
jgi:hypothetical protein